MLESKLSALRSRQSEAKDRARSNEELGARVCARVMRTARPNECDKYKLHVEEVDKITSLLIGLAGRLARAENAVAMADAKAQDEKVSFVLFSFFILHHILFNFLNSEFRFRY